MKKKYNLPIREWPEGERPREKLLAGGPECLSDAELVAIMLRTGNASAGMSALDQARALLARFGSLPEIESAGVREICELPGVGPAKAASIKAALAMGRRLAEGKKDLGDPIASPEDVFARFKGRFSNLKKESFWVLLLDIRGRVIKEVRISEGSLTESLVHPREAFLPAVRESAAKVIFVHNHPSGDPIPSRTDALLNERLVETGELLGIPVLDHVVVCADSFRCIEPDRSAEGLERKAADSKGGKD